MAHLNSLDFILFSLVVFALARLSIRRAKSPVLLAVCSIFFAIAATNEYVATILVGIAIVCYYLGRFIQGATSPLARRGVLVAALVGVWTLALLSSRYDWLQLFGETLVERLPFAEQLRLRSLIVVWSSKIGISFLALRITSYLVDSSFREERISFLAYVIYLFYFPAYLAGPVDRPWIFAEKLESWDRAPKDNVLRGLDRYLSGLFKKFVLADLLHSYAIDSLALDTASTADLWLGIFVYSLYIYWDFSGYTDIALGVSQCLGIPLPENFARPYFKTDLSEFWNSWHISFSFWLRDYLFAPLNLFLGRQGILPAAWTPVPPLIITMLACGLWHGYTAGFLVWGLHHGIGLSFHRMYQTHMQRYLGRKRYRVLVDRADYRFLCWLTTLLYVSLGWVWFAVPLGQCGRVFAKLIGLE